MSPEEIRSQDCSLSREASEVILFGALDPEWEEKILALYNDLFCSFCQHVGDECCCEKTWNPGPPYDAATATGMYDYDF